MNNIRAHIIWSLCLLIVYGLAFCHSGNVLCISDSGRVKIESIYQFGHRYIGEVFVMEQNPDVLEHLADCNACTDVPLTFDTYVHRFSIKVTDITSSIPDILPLASSSSECSFTTVQACSQQDNIVSGATDALLSVTVIRC